MTLKTQTNAFYLWLLLTFNIYHVSGCDYSFPGPIVLELNNRIGNMTVGEVTEMQFDLLLPAPCLTGFCRIIRVYDPIIASDVRAPVVMIPAKFNKTIKTGFSDSNSLSAGFGIYNTVLYNSMTDGTYHTWYFKWSPTERIIIFDGIVYFNTTGIFDSSQFIGQHYGIYATDVFSNLINGTATIKNLCINSTWYSDSDPNSCDIYHKNPMKVIQGTAVDALIMNKVLIISFDLQIESNWTCPSGWCNILRISPSNGNTPRLPMLAILPSDHGFHSVFGLFANDWTDPYLLENINDGSFHSLYLKYSDTERIFLFNDKYIGNITNGMYNNSAYIGNEYTLWISKDNAHATPSAWIKNLCIRLYATTSSPTHGPTKYPSMYPTKYPSIYPTTNLPTAHPSKPPTMAPTSIPTNSPTNSPTNTNVREVDETISTIFEQNTIESLQRNNSNIAQESMIYIGSSAVLILFIIIGIIVYCRRKHKKVSVEHVTNCAEMANVRSISSDMIDVNDVKATVDTEHEDMYDNTSGNNKVVNDTITAGLEENNIITPSDNRNSDGDEEMYETDNVTATPYETIQTPDV